MNDDADEHEQFRWYDPRRCLYTILLSREEHPALPFKETPYAHIDAKLVLSSAALYGTATLPVGLLELLLGPVLLRFKDELRPRHVVGYVFDDQWEEINSKMLSIYPFGVVYDLRSKELVSTPPGQVAIRGLENSVSNVIQAWIDEGDAAIARVAPYWPQRMIADLQGVHARLKASWPVHPKLPVAPAVNQDCLRPNAIIRNLARGYWADETWNQETQPPMDLSDPHAVQRQQCAMADEIIARTHEARGHAKPEAMIIAPAVNPAVVSKLFSRVRSQGPRSLGDALLKAKGYLLYIDPADLADPNQHALIEMLMSIRGSEKTFYDAVATMWASAGRNIVFRTPHMPGRLFDNLDALASMDWSSKNIIRAMTRWQRYCTDLTQAFGEDQLRWISSNVERLTVLSDLPIEWCQIDGVPLGFLMPISRIPLAPGNFPVRLLIDPRPPAVWESVESVRVLVVDGHDNDDVLRHIQPRLAETVSNLGFSVEFERIRNASDLEAALVRHRPNILYLSTHGGITKELGGMLALPDGPSQFAAEVGHAPDVAIVSACRSDPVARTYSSPARNLFGAGVRGVLASYLNLTEPHAFFVAIGLFANLRGSLHGQAPGVRTWEQLVWMTLNSRRPIDILVGAYRRQKKSTSLKDISLLKAIASFQLYVRDLFAPYVALHDQEGIPFRDTWHLAPERLRRLAKDTPYRAAIEAVTRQHAFRPESMFYTQIGEPQRVLILPKANSLDNTRPGSDPGAVDR